MEHRLRVGSAGMPLLLPFQSSRSMFGTPLEGLAAVDGEGMVRWFNGGGAQLFDSPRRPAEGLAAEDRKSTRLNSSHTVISYAVFCLKKKKKKSKTRRLFEAK